MESASYNISLDFNQIMQLVRQLPVKQKIRLSKELEKEAIKNKLADLLSVFKTDELDENTIKEEVDQVRESLYAKKKKI